MKTTRKALIFLLLVVVCLLLMGAVAVPALLLVGAAGDSLELSKDLVMDMVLSNVDNHPPVDAIVENIPNDCLECHNERHYSEDNPQRLSGGHRHAVGEGDMEHESEDYSIRLSQSSPAFDHIWASCIWRDGDNQTKRTGRGPVTPRHRILCQAPS